MHCFFHITESQLYAGTVADFSGTDSLIYRRPQRTERSDLRQLNNPSFVNSLRYEDYAFFFYRETAVEYMNCGKVNKYLISPYLLFCYFSRFSLLPFFSGNLF